MNRHQFDIRCLNAPTVLPRVALMFTRRGLPIEQLELATSDDSQFQHMSTPRAAAQMLLPSSSNWRVVEIADVSAAAASDSQTPKPPNGVKASRSPAGLMSHLDSLSQFAFVWRSQIGPI